MARICTNCGSEIPEGASFCTECGTSLTEESATAPAPEAAPAAPVSEAPAPPPAEPAWPPKEKDKKKEDKGKKQTGVVSTAYYFLMMLLYSIPAVGWLLCLVIGFAARNESKKNFAKAMLIWIVIGIALTVIGYFVLRWLGSSIVASINESTGSSFKNLDDMLRQLQELKA